MPEDDFSKLIVRALSIEPVTRDTLVLRNYRRGTSDRTRRRARDEQFRSRREMKMVRADERTGNRRSSSRILNLIIINLRGDKDSREMVRMRTADRH